MSEKWDFEGMVDLFSREGGESHLVSGKWGLEKEALRVTPEGELAPTPHPSVFGNKITNESVTTDFAESQVEIITPALESIELSYARLKDTQSYVRRSIGNELLWPLSMPGVLPAESDIPLAKYDGSEEGNKREIYRTGLSYRYGKQMQMISGIHYNFSLGDNFWEPLLNQYLGNQDIRSFKDEAYFSLAINFIKYRWLLVYLFGSSPVGTEEYKDNFFKQNRMACRDIIEEYQNANQVEETVSMRMSCFGYENAFQNTIVISHKSLATYIADLRKVLKTRNDAYQQIGVFRDGKQIQLNDNLLQSENEYYAPIRFKQLLNPDETMLEALERRGILYLELRTFDIDPFEDIGISLETMYFIHAFLLFCLFKSNRNPDDTQLGVFTKNAHNAALYGRKKGLVMMKEDGSEADLPSWGGEILDKVMTIARLMDKTNNRHSYENSVKTQIEKLKRTELLPSSRIIELMKAENADHARFGLSLARKYTG